MEAKTKESGPILLAEDDDQYAFIIKLAFKQAGIQNPVHWVRTGDQVISYLAGEGHYADRQVYPIPAVIVLALRLPLEDDFKALRWLRAQHEFDNVGVIVLSGMEYDDERGMARRLGADCYHAKPLDFHGLVEIARRIRQCWLEQSPDREAA